jgi:integrase
MSIPGFIPLVAKNLAVSKQPNAADALDLLSQVGWGGLTKKQRDDRASAVRTLVRICCPEVGNRTKGPAFLSAAQMVPMDCAYLNKRLYEQSPTALGLPPKHVGKPARRFENVVVLLRDVLRRHGQHAPELPRADKLAPAWNVLHAALTIERRKALIAFMGYCTREEIAPAAVDNATLDAFEAWTVAHTIHRDPHGRARRIASNWNWAGQNIGCWPASQLTRPGMRDEYTLPFSAYPISFREDLARFLERLACTSEQELFPDDIIAPRTKSPRSRRQPREKRTLETREYQIRQAAAALVRSGIPPESLLRLRDMVEPVSRVRDILTFHRQRTLDKQGADGKAPVDQPLNVRTTNLAGIAEALRQIGVFHCADAPEGALPEADIARITAWARSVVPENPMVMTDKNMQRLRKLVEPRNYALLLHYPEALEKRAASLYAGGPKHLPRPRPAALLVMYAVALDILTVCPLRRENLARLRLDQHLVRVRPDGPIDHIHLAANEVKNDAVVHWPLAPETGQLIELYVQKYRPHLAEPGNPFLFPDSGQGGRAAQNISTGLIKMVERDIGVEFNLHLMRHLAVLRYLRAHPGQYEVVRRILGHKKVATTMAYYAGLEDTVAAANALHKVVSGERQDTRLVASAAFGWNASRRGAK